LVTVSAAAASARPSFRGIVESLAVE
jgi:hypothetical protein